MDTPRHPAGPYTPEPDCDDARRDELMAELAALPGRVREAVAGLDDAQLDTPYRPDAWTIRQIVHHLADSHMHALIRCKWALTEDHPTIKPYDQTTWAELADTREGDVAPSLAVLDGVHARWLRLLRSLDREQRARTFHHPETDASVSITDQLSLYAWHGRHHLAQVVAVRRREGWTAESARGTPA